jgi:hypothetical protein
MSQSGATMIEQYYFETSAAERQVSPAKVRKRLARIREQEDRRRQQELKLSTQESVNLLTAIAGLGRTISILEINLEQVLTSAKARDASRFDYPIAARTLAARRDNLKVTVEAMSKRLSELNVTRLRLAG